ncbi:ankyrin repeat domain-containing protein [Vibrio sp. S4M6]|uniref:ankyrin repeat domain-containing protein n=1 Tax=Vibrio sinus TaxID=2946865 RepID=UPI002029E0B4|nr:ankyrin repeat domain-containing protein [Vibrio sinus]MCL9780232.1 ankyrin repeat domain-containing protein [Vibrio sinus]
MKKISIEVFRKNKGLVDLFSLFYNPLESLQNEDCDWFLDTIQQCGPVSDKTCSNGNNMLHYALMINNPYAKLIAQQRPSLKSQKNLQGQLPVHFAAFHRSIDLAYYMPEKNTSMFDERGFSPLHISAEKGHIHHWECLKSLSDSGNMFDALPLHWVMKNHEKNSAHRLDKLMMAKTMLNENRQRHNMSVANAIGMSPRDWMESTCSDQEIDYLLK